MRKNPAGSFDTSWFPDDSSDGTFAVRVLAASGLWMGIQTNHPSVWMRENIVKSHPGIYF